MSFLTPIYNIITKVLGFIVLPVFKFLRMILWDKTLRKFFNDVLKVTFLVDLIDDFLDVCEALIKDPAKLLVMSNFSSFIIFAPWIINLLLFPLKKANLAKQQKKQEQQYMNYYQQLAQSDPVAYQNLYLQQQGGKFLNILSSAPSFTDYIGVFAIVFFVYFYEKSDFCNIKYKKNQEKNKDQNTSSKKWDEWNLTKYSFWIAIIITLFYIANYLVFPFIPIIGIFFRISNGLPIVGTLVPGLLTYFAYNMLRNITEIMKDRTSCV